MNNRRTAELALGCWSFGNDRYWGDQSHSDTIRTIHAALRNGITRFDTAAVYANGRSEQITGQQLKKIRDRVIITTKSMYHPPEKMQKAIDTSLRRLCTDYIDIFYLHWPSKGKDFRPLMEILEKNRTSGKIRAIGVSNFSPEQMQVLLTSGDIDYCQTGYSLIWRKPYKKLIPFCLSNSIKIEAYSPLAQGILTDRFINSKGYPEGDPRNRLVFFNAQSRTPLLEFLAELKKEAVNAGVPVSRLALSWILSRSYINTVIAGARNRRQIEENCKTLNDYPDKGIIDRLTELSDKLEPRIINAENIFNHSTGV